MSQLKASPPPQAQSPFSLPHNQDLHTTSRIMTRRASRSAQSSVSNHIAAVQENDTADSESTGRMTTRSRSADLNPQTSNPSSAEESSASSVSGTTPTSNNHHASTGTSSRRQNQTHHQKSSQGRVKRVAKPSTSLPVRQRRGGGSNAKETKSTSGTMDALRQQKLAQLDELEKSILDGTHQEYRERMAHAEKKRMDQIRIAQVRRGLQEDDIRSAFDACRKAAHDHFHQSRATLRRLMIGEVQAQIKRLEEEWQAHNGFLEDDDQELDDWVPPDRQTSIHCEPLGLATEEMIQDLKIASIPYAP